MRERVKREGVGSHSSRTCDDRVLKGLEVALVHNTGAVGDEHLLELGVDLFEAATAVQERQPAVHEGETVHVHLLVAAKVGRRRAVHHRKEVSRGVPVFSG